MADLHTNILILHTPRTGSALLCECMTQAGVFGKVNGFWTRTNPQEKKDFVSESRRWINNHQHNGVHATAAALNFFDLVTPQAGAAAVDNFMKQFTHYIVLQRKDKVAQAVSYYVALSSQEWTSTATNIKPYPPYNYWQILWLMSFSIGSETRAQLFAEGTGRPVLHLWYEDIIQNLTGTVQEIADFSGLPLGNIVIAPTLKKLHHPLKDEYIARFNEEWINTDESSNNCTEK